MITKKKIERIPQSLGYRGNPYSLVKNPVPRRCNWSQMHQHRRITNYKK